MCRFALLSSLLTAHSAPCCNQLAPCCCRAAPQIAALLNGAGQVASQLQALAPPKVAAEAVKAPLAGLDAALSNTIGTVAKGVEDTLSSLAPPEVVIGRLVQPLAAGLNEGLTGLLAALNATATKGPQAGLPALLEGVTGGLVRLRAAIDEP